MSENKMMRLIQAAKKLNVGIATIVEFLSEKGIDIKNNPNAKITHEQFNMLAEEFEESLLDKEEASQINIGINPNESVVTDKEAKEENKGGEEQEIIIKTSEVPEAGEKVEKVSLNPKLSGLKVIDKISLEKSSKDKEKKKKEEEPVKEEKPQADQPEEKPKEIKEQQETIKAKAETLKGLTVKGKIELPAKKEKKKPVASSDEAKKKKRVRIRKRIDSNKEEGDNDSKKGFERKSKFKKRGKDTTPKEQEVTEKEIQEQIKATLAKMSGGPGKKKVVKKSVKKDKVSEDDSVEDEKLLRVTEFISANELASLMEVPVTEVISKCLSLGMFVSINQRLDAEAITIIADEFGYQVSFISAEEEADVEFETEEDDEKDLEDRPPIVTVMGHVDHGKTSLLDCIRNANVTASESGGITQHIGAYNVKTKDGRVITFLDTPGHEAFTAMRARGAKLTDVVIIVVAADDNVMPQTREAINHAQVADVPIVIAINKIDKPGANPDRIKEQLAKENILVEDWGGKYQCEMISAKKNEGIDELLEKVLLEAEVLELKANPNKNAIGTVIEASLDKGRGYVTNLLVQSGTLKIGDIILAGAHYGRVKAMTDHNGKNIKKAAPSVPVSILGLSGAPQAGDKFNVMDNEREARDVANKREQIIREQTIRATHRVTLEDIGRRIALGNFQELNVIVKGDVDGSVEALSDSLLKLSTDEIQVNIIHKGVGQITESDINLADVSDAVIIGFQVRPSANSRKMAEEKGIEIRLYSIIYDAINELKDAMEGMLAPEVEEVIVGNVQVREVFKISKVGTIAGCYVTDGYIKRNSEIRVIRDGIVIHSGFVDTLKRFKDDVAEVKTNYECGLSVKNFNDLKVEDNIEVFEKREVKRKLK